MPAGSTHSDTATRSGRTTPGAHRIAPPAPAPHRPATPSLPFISPPLARDSDARAALHHTRLRPRRFRTRRRLFLAFAALAVAFVAASGFQLAGMDRMKRALEELHEHEDQMLLALELENAVRTQFLHQAHFAEGGTRGDGYPEARARSQQLLRTLSTRVNENEADRWVAEIDYAVHELDRLFQQENPAARAPGAMTAPDGAYRFVFMVEDNVDRLFRLLRLRTVELSRAIDEMRDDTVRLAIAFVAGTLLAALALALYLSRSIARPLATIGAGAARIASGNLTARIDLSGTDEFGTLAAEVNDMAAALKREQEELVRSEKLASVGRMAAGVAHEINNPLQVILGYLSFHRGRVRGELGRHLARVEREATRCKEIVESLLQLARPAAAVEASPVDLREIADEVADALRIGAGRAARIGVTGEGTALGTASRFQQIVLNLAKNATEAAGPEGEVRIEVRNSGAWVEVAVSDTGPGIPSPLHERVFEPFFSTKSGGTGLGLAISRALASSLGGELRLEASESGGACFTLRVPSLQGSA